MTIDLSGRVAAVTGSDSGIGQAIALALANAGADVAASFHSDEAGAEETARLIRERGRRASFAALDVRDPASVGRYFDHVRTELGAVDILVNNAGLDGERKPVAELDLDAWDLVFNVNLRGAFLCARNVLPSMIERRRGVVLNISSVHETIPWAGQAAYCAAKAGLAMMTRCLALELQDSGVRAVALAPGAIRTPINQDVWEDPAQAADLEEKIPMRRIGETDEIARLAVVLVSDAASYVTGTTVTADGGMTAYPSFISGG